MNFFKIIVDSACQVLCSLLSKEQPLSLLRNSTEINMAIGASCSSTAG